MFRIVSLLIGYAVGLIQSSYIVGRLSGIDIRNHGSGNAGTTNTLRVLGFKAGLIVFVCDVLKGVLAFMICSALFDGSGTFISGSTNVLPGLYGGAGAILGHCFPFYLGFKGGKGMASTLGVILCTDPYILIAIAIVGIACVAISKYISVATLTIGVMFPLGMIILKYPPESVILCFAIGALSWYLHRGNIMRLKKGEENKFTIKGRLNN